MKRTKTKSSRRNKLSKRWALIAVGAAVAIAFLLLAACGDGEEEAAPAAPSVEITSLNDGQTVPAGNLPVEVAVSDFNVVSKLGEADTSGEGHIHFYLLRPDEPVPTAPGQPAVTAEGTYHAEAVTSYTWPDVQPGTYKVAAQLVNNGHTPLTPPVVTEITVTVE